MKKRKGSLHDQNPHVKKKDGHPKPARASRKTTEKSNQLVPVGLGRPKGSKVNKEWGLTQNQMDLAHQIMEIELDAEGLFPTSASQLARAVGRPGRWVRDMLNREDFQRYLKHVMNTDGFVMEGAFIRGMQLGLQVGDAKILELYAKMTGKIQKERREERLVIEIKAPDGTAVIPAYTIDEDGDVVKAEIIEGEVVEETED